MLFYGIISNKNPARMINGTFHEETRRPPMFNLRREIEALLKKYPDPRKKAAGLYEFRKRQVREAALPRYGTVVDNKDPQCLGRVKVACDTIGPGVITPWIPVISPGAGPGYGWWQLPDIGTQVLLFFPFNCLSCPIVLGSVYDEKHRPPEHPTKNRADSVVYQTKGHRMEFVDEEGNESEGEDAVSDER
jgi:hypothetical protein